ncbi:MAG: Hsp20/alpha crystallin family protein [Candidatus Magasanikbacteria bacterium]|jgi:HSP20 family protein|nr:Hsp20/alpha crystallin family protein [Candidatus Magasanikbacteria bacterium]MBT4071581.1 Hsp20/alpha crystallin family protein [Candidatus Magasanikbacteria bacterium]
MSLTQWNPNLDPFTEIEEVMKRHLPAFNHKKSFVPAINMYEKENAVIVEAPLAGVNVEDVEISVEKGILLLQGQSYKEHEVDDKNYYRKEVRSGSFYRHISLPMPVKEDEISAKFENGILKITCPKAGEGESKKIDIKIK